MTLPPIASPFPAAPQRPEAPRPMFSSLAISASGLSAQRVRMDVIAQNLANAETTKTPQGGPYQRKVVNLEAIEPSNLSAVGTVSAGGFAGQPGLPVPGAAAGVAAAQAAAGIPMATPIGMVDASGGVRVASIGTDATQGPMVYDPANPNADKNGYVQLPNVNMTDELMDLMNARRIYEANATVFQVARAMLHKAIDI
jgi:flagellar basal-body rod protein FlgC